MVVALRPYENQHTDVDSQVVTFKAPTPLFSP